MVAPAGRTTLCTIADWKPPADASTRYVPGPRFAALYSPSDDVMTPVTALVPMLMTLTDAPAIAALAGSVNTPVILPRSDCAKQHTAATSKVVQK